jgi:lysophospholipase L1-like esterase
MMKTMSAMAALVVAGIFVVPAFGKAGAAGDRRTGRPQELWAYYMHGVVDHYAQAVDWKELFGPEQDPKSYLVSDQPIDTPYKKSATPALRLVKSQSVDLARPLPMDMTKTRGQTVRVFIWLKGEDVGARNNCWHAPGMIVRIRDGKGQVLSEKDGYFQTQRTYPWHCYYTEVFVPKEAEGIYLRLFGKSYGKAYFSSPAWEVVMAENNYSVDEMQDPYTGSLAFNPKYDEMPYHLKHGTLEAFRYPWRFVLGGKIGLVGQRYDITTKEGFRRYYFEKAKKEPEHMNHGILYMGSMYRGGMAKNVLPPMEKGWLENFANILVEDQDPKTGFWHDGISLSLGLTFHLCDMHFRYRGIPRPDREEPVRPDLDLGLKKIPRAQAIIRTVLRQQSTWTDPQGVKRKGAWNWPAYRYTETPDAFAEKCYLGSTWDAINLIRRSSNYVDAGLRKQVDQSVREAFYYVLRACVLDDGTFKQHDTDGHPTGPNYMGHILEDSAWLERRVVPTLLAPRVEYKEGSLVWLDPKAEQNSVRVYLAPNGTLPEKINESFLVGVIQRTGHKVYEMDPFLGVQKIRQAACSRWGGSMELSSPDSWQGKRYLPWKLRMIRYPLAFSDDGKPLTLKEFDLKGKDMYVSAADWYGEESKPAQVVISDSAPAAKGKKVTTFRSVIKVVLVGDSTVATYPLEKTMRGWGQMIPEFFTDQVQFVNLALGGRSSKSFRAEGHWAKALAQKPDYIFIQFGHNDCPGKGPQRETDPKTTYRDNLREYIKDARRIGAKVVLVTSVERRKFGEDGKITNSLRAYAEGMKAVAAGENVPVVDLNGLSIKLYDRLGEAGSGDLSFSASDRTHFSEKGARAMASLVAENLPVPELRRFAKKSH